MKRIALTFILVCWSSLVLAQAPPQTAPAPPPLQPNPRGPLYQHTGEQYRVYEFPGTTESIPYRLFVPSRWKPGARLPLLVTLRAGQSVDNPYREPNSLITQAEQRGYLVVTPMGYRPLRQPVLRQLVPNRETQRSRASRWMDAARKRARGTGRAQRDRSGDEGYGVDTSRIFLHGQNPSGSGALHLGAKYPERFAALVISSGPIVFDSYPFDRLKGKVRLMVIHGDQDTTNPIEASKQMADAARAAGVTTTYATVPGGTHLGAYLTYAREIFDFLDEQRPIP